MLFCNFSLAANGATSFPGLSSSPPRPFSLQGGKKRDPGNEVANGDKCFAMLKCRFINPWS